jgi:hypothetical protein
MWTPYCPKKSGVRHETQCKADAACPYCGQPNPNLPDEEVILIPDTPPARHSFPLSGRSGFTAIDPKPGLQSRQRAILETRGEGRERPHAGYPVHGARPKAPVLKGSQVAKKLSKVIVSVHYGTLQHEELRTYAEWEFVSKDYSSTL